MAEYVKIGNQNFAMKMKATCHWGNKTCYFCGKHFKTDEEISLIVLPSDIRFNGGYKKMKDNQVVHTSELESFIENMTTIKEVADAMEKHKVKKETLSEELEKRMETFVCAASKCGFSDFIKKKDGTVICKKYGSSDTIRYNVYTDIIEYHNKRKKALFDGFLGRQIETNVYNKFHELLGDNKHSDYDALTSIGECISTANKIIEG